MVETKPVLASPPMRSTTARSAGSGTGGTGRRAAFLLSVVATILMSAASAAGVMMGALYRDPESLSSMLRGFDAVTLLLVVPSLAAALVGVARRSPIAELIWVGLLAAAVYTYAFHVFATSFNDLFLAHIVVLSCSTFALVLALASLDVSGIGSRFGPRTPTRAIGLFLAFLALGLGGMWIYHALRFAISDVVPAGSALVETDAVVHLGFALDLSLLVPAYVAACVLLWRRAAWGTSSRPWSWSPAWSTRSPTSWRCPSRPTPASRVPSRSTRPSRSSPGCS